MASVLDWMNCAGGSSDRWEKGILRSIHTIQANGVPEKIVFVRKRNKKSNWLAILSKDCTLSYQENIRIYGMRWYTEVFLKRQSPSYNTLICHTTIVFVRYIVLS